MSEIRQTVLREINNAKEVTGVDVTEAQIQQLEEQAQQLKDKSRRDFRDMLELMAEDMRGEDFFGNDLVSALVYYYGREFDEEVVQNMDKFHPADHGQLVEFIDAMEPLTDAVLPVPVIINSPQGYSDMHSRDTWREFHFVLANPDFPYYAKIRTKDDVLMHAFTGAKDSTVRRSFGIEGQTYQASTAMRNRTIGSVSLLSAKNMGGECELLMEEHAVNRRSSGMPSTYSYSGDSIDLIHSSYGHNTYTVGWSAVEDLVFDEPAGKQRVTAAKNVAKLLFPDYLDMRVHMPRVAKIIKASADLRDASGE